MAVRNAERIAGIAQEAFDLLLAGRQIAPFSRRAGGLDLDDAYRVAAQVRDRRQDRGERVVGRKIGFTNRAIWTGYGISGPIWGYMYDKTVSELSPGTSFSLAGFTEPRIEPEIVLHFKRAPSAAMDEDELLTCVDWIAHGFEIVHSIFPGWEFSAADAVVAYGVHGALLVGPPHYVAGDRPRWTTALEVVHAVAPGLLQWVFTHGHEPSHRAMARRLERMQRRK